MAVMMGGPKLNPPTPGPEASKTDLSDRLQLVERLINGLERYRRQAGPHVFPDLFDAEVAVAFRQDTKDG
jgi:hypothetical protein